MTSKRKTFWLVACTALAIGGAGCSGINVSRSVSPASFFLPGLLKADPPRQLESPPKPGELPSTLPGDEPLPQVFPTKQLALAR